MLGSISGSRRRSSGSGAPVFGPNLIAEGDGASGSVSAWTPNAGAVASETGGRLRIGGSGFVNYVAQSVSVEAGEIYRFDVDKFVGPGSAGCQVTVGTSFTASDLVNTSGAGTYGASFVGPGGQVWVTLYNYGAGTYSEYDNVQIRKVIG